MKNLSLNRILWGCLAVLAAFNTGAVGQEPIENRPLILAHYMPWYAAKPASDRWGWHWTMNHFDPDKQVAGKREIASKFYPLIGPYDSGDLKVLEYHLLTMKLSGIDGVIVDWYGLTNFRDYAVLHRNTTRLLQQCERLQMKFVICYEDQTIPALVEGHRIDADEVVSHAVEEIQWLGRYWFQSPSYVREEGKPVLLSFGHAGLTNPRWKQCLERIGFPIAYYSQDYRRPGATGGFGWPAPKIGLSQTDRFLNSAKDWPSFIPAAFPRFVDIYRDAKVSDGYPELPDDGGRTFRDSLAKAIDSKATQIQIATWNDWGEGTQIEPSEEFGYRDLLEIKRLREPSERWDPDDAADSIKLPLRLLRLRQAGRHAAEDLNEISDAISDGRLSEASQRIDALSSD